MNNFSISMNSNVFNGCKVTKQLIKEAIDYVEEQNKMGNYEFLTLINEEDNSFIQFVIENDGYHVEIRYPNLKEGKGVYVKKILDYRKMVDTFYDFYEGKSINTTEYDDISYYLK